MGDPGPIGAGRQAAWGEVEGETAAETCQVVVVAVNTPVMSDDCSRCFVGVDGRGHGISSDVK